MTAMMMTIMATMMMTITTAMGNTALTAITTTSGTDTARVTTETLTATALGIMGAPVVAIPAVRAAAARTTGTADIAKRREKDTVGTDAALTATKTGITTTAHGVMGALVVTVEATKATGKTTGRVDVIECGERRGRIVRITVGVGTGVDAVVDTDVDIGRR